jgi:RNA polymerase sigma-70 factor (ECF subfamily)
MSKQNEQIAIQKVLEGNTEAFEILVKRYQKGLCIYLFNMLRDDMLAEDIAQESFLQAFQKLNTYNLNYSFSTWLYRIARNKALRHIEKNKKNITNYDFESVEHTTLMSAHEEVTQNENREHIQMIIRSLKPEYQEVLNLYYWNGKSYSEISDIIDRPVNTVRTLLHRSKESIRKELYG